MMRDIMLRFVKPCAVANKDLVDVDYISSHCHKSDDLMILFDKACGFLEELSSDERKVFFASARKFFIRALEYIKAKLPVSDSVLQHCEIADVDSRDRSASLKWLLERFPCLQPEGVSKSQLLLEYSQYFALDQTLISKDDPMDKRWEDIKCLKDEEGTPVAPNLALLMQHILCIPHSSAHCERVFSVVRKIKTDQRSSVGEDTMEALLILKSSSNKSMLENLTEENLVRLKSAYHRSLSQ